MNAGSATISVPMRWTAATLTLGLLCSLASAQDAETATPPVPAVTSAPASEKPAEAAPEIVFGNDYEAALKTARAEQRPVLVVAVPDWYESPVWASVEEQSVGTPAGRAALERFVPVLLRESNDREVHARHRVPYRTHPLAVVLDADGSYLGFLSGLPTEGGAAAWSAAVAGIVPRAKRTREVRDALAESPDDPALLLELATLLLAAGEHARADDVFARVERVEPIGNEERLGEARYQRLRMRVVDLLEQKKWGDVEPLCLKWRRRFSEHTRMPALLLLQANARFLSGQGDRARELWTRITSEHGGSDAAKRAKECLDEYPEKPEKPDKPEKPGKPEKDDEPEPPKKPDPPKKTPPAEK